MLSSPVMRNSAIMEWSLLTKVEPVDRSRGSGEGLSTMARGGVLRALVISAVLFTLVAFWVPIDLGGMYASDDPINSRKWMFPPGLIVPAGGFLLLWADADPIEGIDHVGFHLIG